MKVCSQFFLVFTLLLMLGCVSTPHRGDEKSVVLLDAHASQSDVVPTRYEKKIYQVLLAETAYQRGQFQQAVDGYLSAALGSRDPALVERACYMALNADRQDAGLQMAQYWVSLEPESVKARYFLALFYMRKGQLKLVQEQLEQTLSIDVDGNALGFFGVAEILGELGGHDALFVMQKVVADYPDNVNALVALSQLALRVGEFDEALSSVTYARSLMPDRVDALLLQIQILQARGDGGIAIDHLAHAIDQHPADVTLRQWYAQLLEASGREEEAFVQFKIVESQSPMDGDAIFSLGVLAFNDSRWALAQTYMQRLLDIGGFNNEANYYLGWLAELEGTYAEAIEFYSSVNLEGAYFDAQIRLAYNTAKLGDLNVARGYLESIEPEGVVEVERVFIAQGELLRDARQFEEAIEVYSRGLQKLPGNHELLYARAMVAEAIGHNEQMKQDLEAIIASDPKSTNALNALGYALVEHGGDIDKAEGYLLRALALDPQSYYIIDSVGWLYYRRGEYAKAIEYLNRAYNLGKDAEVAAHLGEVLWVIGDYEGAKDIWDRALKDAPGHKALLGVVERFSAQ
ncbi:MAG: tetratricopeptide repeat protein [Gammaproteobacteria bacterium]|nr:tetratricopeptide repeat protein [Gammaproteobacteria bacterium]